MDTCTPPGVEVTFDVYVDPKFWVISGEDKRQAHAQF